MYVSSTRIEPQWGLRKVRSLFSMQGRVGQHPAVQGGVVHLQTALEEQLLDVTVAQGIAQIPRDGLQDQRRLEVPTLEIVLRPALQLFDKGVQDHRPPPVRRRLCRPHAQRAVNARTLRHVWTPALAQEESSGLVQRAVGC